MLFFKLNFAVMGIRPNFMPRILEMPDIMVTMNGHLLVIGRQGYFGQVIMMSFASPGTKKI